MTFNFWLKLVYNVYCDIFSYMIKMIQVLIYLKTAPSQAIKYVIELVST